MAELRFDHRVAVVEQSGERRNLIGDRRIETSEQIDGGAAANLDLRICEQRPELRGFARGEFF